MREQSRDDNRDLTKWFIQFVVLGVIMCNSEVFADSAATDLNGVLCNISNILTGNVAKILVSFGVMVMSYLLLSGKMSWLPGLMMIIAMVLPFIAQGVMDNIVGTGVASTKVCP